MKSSETFSIIKKSFDSKEEISYTEDYLERFNILISDIKEAKKIKKEKEKPFSEIITSLNELVKNEISNLEKTLEKNKDNEFTKKIIEEKKDFLEKINLRDLKDFQKNYTALGSLKNREIDNLLRRAVFIMSFRKENQRNFDLENINLEKPSLDDISWVLDFIDHITNREVMSKYFTDTKAKKTFNKIISTAALKEQLARLKSKQVKTGEVKINFSTHRDIHTEFSGHEGDACWASRYNSILERFPNISSVLMASNPENRFAKVVGSSLLIETKAKNGEDLLIIRGLNPVENTINYLDVEDFFEKFKKFTQDIDEKSEKKLAISIDDHSSGHGTNRPVLNRYLWKLKDGLKKVELENPEDSEFNGYGLQGEVYLL